MKELDKLEVLLNMETPGDHSGIIKSALNEIKRLQEIEKELEKECGAHLLTLCELDDLQQDIEKYFKLKNTIFIMDNEGYSKKCKEMDELENKISNSNKKIETEMRESNQVELDFIYSIRKKSMKKLKIKK